MYASALELRLIDYLPQFVSAHVIELPQSSLHCTYTHVSVAGHKYMIDTFNISK